MYIKGACFFFFVFFETLLVFSSLFVGGIFVHYFSITNDFLRAFFNTKERERERERERRLSLCVLGGDDDDDDGRTDGRRRRARRVVAQTKRE